MQNDECRVERAKNLEDAPAEQEQAIEQGESATVNEVGTESVLVLRDIYLCLGLDTEPWTIGEMNLLADEAEEMISQKESDITSRP